MTLSLRAADDRAGLRPMEKWSNTGTAWSNQTTMSPLYYHNALASNTRSMFPLSSTNTPLFSRQQAQPNGHTISEQQVLAQAFSQANSGILESPKGSFDGLLNTSSSSMADSTSEMTGEEDNVHCSATSEQMNCIPVGVVPNMSQMPAVLSVSSDLHLTVSTGASTSSLSVMSTSPALQKNVFCLAPESPGGPLSPSALHTANCSRGESEDSLGCDPNVSLKRPFEEESWMEQLRAENTPKQQEKALAFQDNFPESPLGYGEPNQFPAPYLNTSNPLAIPNPAMQPFLPSVATDQPITTMDKMASMRAILFRATLPPPSAEEIANSRPKRRNVRISKDPQSVAARHRRERISDRIRVLQRLVPGGTKMDTASMLDEAIHYVKFLKLQLQALEQLGHGSDPRFLPQGGGPLLPQMVNSVRPFDLNCAAYQGNCPSANATHQNSQAGSHSSSAWPSSSSPFCGQGFQDPLQEQFCH